MASVANPHSFFADRDPGRDVRYAQLRDHYVMIAHRYYITKISKTSLSGSGSMNFANNEQNTSIRDLQVNILNIKDLPWHQESLVEDTFNICM